MTKGWIIYLVVLSLFFLGMVAYWIFDLGVIYVSQGAYFFTMAALLFAIFSIFKWGRPTK